MSDLQVVLIVLGGFIIAGVVVYNWLQERKLRENIAEDFIVPKKDILVEEFYVDADALVDKEFAGDAHKSDIIKKLNEDDVKIEPSLSEGSLPEVAVEPIDKEEATDSADEVVLEKESMNEEAPVAEDPLPAVEAHKDILPPELHPITTSTLPGNVHSQMDLTAFLYASKKVDGYALHTLMKSTLKDLNILVQQHGLDDKDVWQVIDAETEEGRAYKQVACSLQLADRKGPIPKPELNKFQFAIETVGLELNAQIEWQNKSDPVQRSVDLDKFCMDVDQLVSVHLIHGDTPVHGTKFKGLVESSGMILKQGKFSYFEGASVDAPQFVLINADNQAFTADSLRNDIVRGATFQIEIPKVKNCEQAFDTMIAIAQKTANSVGARMVDDNQKPLGDLQIEKIRQQLKVIHATMVARGIMPGSASSMRLFN